MALYDGAPVPKVIDFGVAKATAQKLTEQDDVHRVWPTRRHAGVHDPRAGEAQPARHRYAQRHLFAGRAALRAAHRLDAVRPIASAARLPSTKRCGSSARKSRPSRARSSSVERHAAGDRRQSQRGAGPAPQAGPRRAGLDRDEVPGKGPQPPLRIGQCVCGRRAALPARRAGASVSAFAGLSPAEVCAAEQAGAGDRDASGRDAVRGGGGRGRQRPVVPRKSWNSTSTCGTFLSAGGGVVIQLGRSGRPPEGLPGASSRLGVELPQAVARCPAPRRDGPGNRRHQRQPGPRVQLRRSVPGRAGPGQYGHRLEPGHGKPDGPEGALEADPVRCLPPAPTAGSWCPRTRMGR